MALELLLIGVATFASFGWLTALALARSAGRPAPPPLRSAPAARRRRVA